MFNQIALCRLVLSLLSISLLAASCGGQPPITPAVTLAAPVAGTSPAESTQSPPTNTVVPETTTVISPQHSPTDFASFADSFLTDLEKKRQFSGEALIARDSNILLRKGYGFADREKELVPASQTKYHIGSISKQFTAAAILLLQGQGKLGVQDPICAHLSDCPASWQSITLHHLLTHTSGIPDYAAMGDFNRIKATPTTPSEIIARFKDKPLEFLPGERWSYSSSGYALLGQVIEQVSGSSYEDFVQQNILTPLAMNDTGFEQNPDNLAIGYRDGTSRAEFIDMTLVYASGGLHTNVDDLYRWGQALYSEQFLQPELLDLMLTRHVEIEPGVFYGYGTVLWDIGEHRVFDVGGLIDGFSSSFFHFPDDQVSMILLSNQEDSNTLDINSELARKLFGIEP